MIIPIFLLLTPDGPTLEQARTCQEHMEIMIGDGAREGGHVAGPTWFIRGWWEQKASEAGAPEDDSTELAAAKTGLGAMRTAEPERFRAGRQDCVDTAIDAGAVPGLGPG